MKILLYILPVRTVDTEMRDLDPSSVTALVPIQRLEKQLFNDRSGLEGNPANF